MLFLIAIFMASNIFINKRMKTFLLKFHRIYKNLVFHNICSSWKDKNRDSFQDLVLVSLLPGLHLKQYTLYHCFYIFHSIQINENLCILFHYFWFFWNDLKLDKMIKVNFYLDFNIFWLICMVSILKSKIKQQIKIIKIQILRSSSFFGKLFEEIYILKFIELINVSILFSKKKSKFIYKQN